MTERKARSPMREDIVDRLRNLDAANCADSDHLHDGLIVDAADEIERLRARIAQLEAADA